MKITPEQIQQIAAPPGYKLVPLEPTFCMEMGWAYIDAAREATPCQRWEFSHAGYRAMLAAAPVVAQSAAPIHPPGTYPCGSCDGRGVLYQCVVCGSDEPHTGTCSGPHDPRSLCSNATPAAPELTREEILKIMHRYSHMHQQGYYSYIGFDFSQDVIAFARAVIEASAINTAAAPADKQGGV